MADISIMLVHEGALRSALLLMIICINATDLVNAPSSPSTDFTANATSTFSALAIPTRPVVGSHARRVRSTSESCGRAPRVGKPTYQKPASSTRPMVGQPAATWTRIDESMSMRVGSGCKVERTQELVTEKRITPFQKNFLDSGPHFENHDLVIVLQTTVSTTVKSRAVGAGRPKLPYGNHAECPRRPGVGFGF